MYVAKWIRIRRRNCLLPKDGENALVGVLLTFYWKKSGTVLKSLVIGAADLIGEEPPLGPSRKLMGHGQRAPDTALSMGMKVSEHQDKKKDWEAIVLNSSTTAVSESTVKKHGKRSKNRRKKR